MKNLILLLPVFALILLAPGCSSDKGTTYNLYYLGGQSNMDGYGLVKDLPEELQGSAGDVYIYHGNPARDDADIDGTGQWSILRPGHGAGFSFDSTGNRYSDRFGLELTFASEMKVLEPGTKIAIIKYSLGGTSIDAEAAGNFGSWDPGYLGGEGINQYDHFLATVQNALSIKDIDGDGRSDRLVPSGILWMQGESDGSVSEEIALRYYDNLKELMELIRDALGGKEIPVVIGRISDSGNDPSGVVWDFGDIIRSTEERYAGEDTNAGIVTSTDNYGYSDPWHYDSEGYIDLGRQFALIADSLNRK